MKQKVNADENYVVGFELYFFAVLCFIGYTISLSLLTVAHIFCHFRLSIRMASAKYRSHNLHTH